MSDIHSFADDTSLHASTQFNRPPSNKNIIESRINVAHQLNNDLECIHKWGNKWNVKFNPNKCEQLIISNKKSDAFPEICFDGTPLPVSNHAKLLGVTIDSHLCWSTHITSQAKKAASMLGCLARAKHLIPSSHMNTLYKAKIRPILEYCSTVWGSASDSNLALLSRVEERAASVIGPTFSVPYCLGTRRAVGDLAFLRKMILGIGGTEVASSPLFGDVKLLPPVTYKKAWP